MNHRDRNPMSADDWGRLWKFWAAMTYEYCQKDLQADDTRSFWGTAHANTSYCRTMEMALRMGLRRES